MRVLLTGGAGRVGRTTASYLAQAGHAVTAIGRTPDLEIKDAEYHPCDINNMEQLESLARGKDAIVHLAAIPSPHSISPDAAFAINVAGTFNVYEAASRSGISRVISASSINALGFNYGTKAFPLEYFPVDEETPGLRTDVYSLSKIMGEEIGRYFWDKDGIGGASLRFPWVVPSDEKTIEMMCGRMAAAKGAFAQLQTMPKAEQQKTVRDAIAVFDRYRGERYSPEAAGTHRSRQEAFSPLVRMRSDFWAVIDERDLAIAITKAVVADFTGAHTLFLNDSHNYTGVDTRTLVDLMFPVPDTWTGVWKREVKGTECLVSIDKARDLIGFEPEYSLKRFF